MGESRSRTRPRKFWNSGEKPAIELITEHVYTAQLRASVLKLLDRAA